MNTAGPLSDRPKKELAELARAQGVQGWEAMTKDELVRALRALAKSKLPATPPAPAAKTTHPPAAKPTPKSPPKTSPTDNPPAAQPTAKSAAKVTKPAKPGVNGAHPPTKSGDRAVPTTKPTTPAATSTKSNGTASSATSNGAAKPTAGPTKPSLPATRPPLPPAPKPVPKPTPVFAPIPMPIGKDLSAGKPTTGGPTKDRIFLMVPDPYWLHATWELTHQSVQRAEAALKQDWHGARPIIRLFDVTSTDTTSTSETPVRDIVIHGGCNNWYIDIPQPPRQYRADIGYVSRRGEFFVLARSNVATPPKAGSTEALDLGWAEMDTKKAERIMAMSSGFESSGAPELKELFEERLRRPMGAPKDLGFGTGAFLPGSLKKFFFELDAELIVYGKTEPTAHVTLQNEPVKLRPDGTFTMLFSLPDSRQIIPAVATSADGVEERTIVLAVERNTKHLDPMIHDQMNEN